MRIAALLVLSAFVAQAPAPRGVIEGRVARVGTQDPIPDVLITLVSLNANSAPANTAPPVEPLLPVGTIIGSIALGVGVQPTAITDANGHFIFRDLTSGRYTIRAQRDGYFAPSINGVATTVASANVVLGTGDAIVSKDVSMVKGSVIYGRARDPLGQPISGLTVSAFTVSYPNGRKIWSIARSAQTDDRGEYRLYWLMPGDYFVGATPRTPSAVPGPQDLWLRTFFPGVSDTAAAVPIRIRDGSEVPNTDIDILAASSPGFKISGTAINPLARPNPTTGVIDKSIPFFILSSREAGVLDSVNPPSISNAIPVASRPNGEFEIRNVRPGLYDLYPVAPTLTDPLPGPNPAAPGQPSQGTVFRTIDGTGTVNIVGPPATRRQPTSRTPMNVNGDITGLQIVVNNGIDLTGEVVVTGPAQPIKPESIRVALRSLDTTPTAFVTLIGNISIDAAGKFKVVSVPEGRYTFQSVGGLPAGSYFADIRQGGLSVMDDGFFVDAAALPVQIVISGGGATLEGTVQTADRKSGSAATVVLVPPASRRKNALLYKTAVANEDGRFTMTGIAPGPYKIFAWESIPATAWLNADYISKYEELGRSLTVPGSLEAPLNLIPRDR